MSILVREPAQSEHWNRHRQRCSMQFIQAARRERGRFRQRSKDGSEEYIVRAFFLSADYLIHRMTRDADQESSRRDRAKLRWRHRAARKMHTRGARGDRHIGSGVHNDLRLQRDSTSNQLDQVASGHIFLANLHPIRWKQSFNSRQAPIRDAAPQHKIMIDA